MASRRRRSGVSQRQQAFSQGGSIATPYRPDGRARAHAGAYRPMMGSVPLVVMRSDQVNV